MPEDDVVFSRTAWAKSAQVLAGLEEGAVVIIYPGDKKRDGVRVTTRD
jgi:hypothetical protein